MPQGYFETEIGAEDLEMLAGAIEESTGLQLPQEVVADLAARLSGDGMGAVPPLAQSRTVRRRALPAGSAFAQRPSSRMAQTTTASQRRCGGQFLNPCQGNAELPLPFDSQNAIAAAASQAVTTRPQANFMPYRLLVGSSIAAFFIINDIKIGTRSQFSGSGSLPAETFSNLSVGATLKMDMALTSQDVTINVTNIDVAGHRFLAAMIGEYCY